MVQFGEAHPFFSAGSAGGFQFVQNDQSESEPILEGTFFLMDTFGLKSSPDYDARLVRDVVRLLLVSDLVAPDPRVHQDDLILHFRSGDVFRKNKPPHPGYGQPPLCYYVSAVEREKPSRVWLVFEDEANPCVAATRTVLQERGIQVICQSASLKDDLRVLLSGRRLVSSCGSFVRMIAQLSTAVERVYSFQTETRTPLNYLGINVVSVQDVGGGFANVLSGWSGSEEQLHLMLSYPASALDFRESFATAVH